MKRGTKVRVSNSNLATHGCTGTVSALHSLYQDRVDVQMDRNGKVLTYLKSNLALIMPEPSKDKTFYMLWSPDIKTSPKITYNTLEKAQEGATAIKVCCPSKTMFIMKAIEEVVEVPKTFKSIKLSNGEQSC